MANKQTDKPRLGDDAQLEAPANLPDADHVSTSGASAQIVPDVDMSHPAVGANPRARTSVEQNAIDFNDPTISGQEAVERNLGLTKPD